MGTIRWDSGASGKNRGSGAATVIGTFYKSGNTTTNASSATVIDDGAAGAGSDITFPVGFVVNMTCDELCRVVLGGGTATATLGYLLQPNVARNFEITVAGTISAFDEA